MKINEAIVSNKYSNRLFVRNLYNKLVKLPIFLANLFLVVMYFIYMNNEKKYNYSFVYRLINLYKNTTNCYVQL